jgi:hypothetical protein
VCPGADEPPAARTKLRLVPVQAGPDAVDVRNLGAAQAKRIACTRLLPFRRVGLCCRRQHQDRNRRCQHQAELEIPGPGGNHESPRVFIRELWVKDGGSARTRDVASHQRNTPRSGNHQHQGLLFQEEGVPDDGLPREDRTSWFVAGSRQRAARRAAVSAYMALDSGVDCRCRGDLRPYWGAAHPSGPLGRKQDEIDRLKKAAQP